MQGAASGGGGSQNGFKLQTHVLDIDASPDPLARFNEVNRSKKQRRLQLQPQQQRRRQSHMYTIDERDDGGSDSGTVMMSAQSDDGLLFSSEGLLWAQFDDNEDNVEQMDSPWDPSTTASITWSDGTSAPATERRTGAGGHRKRERATYMQFPPEPGEEDDQAVMHQRQEPGEEGFEAFGRLNINLESEIDLDDESVMGLPCHME